MPGMCEYQLISPPFSLKFDEMSKKEINAYYHWYLDQIPSRIAILERAVTCTPGFEDWKADYLPESLDRLGEWFVMQIETRERTEDDIKKIFGDLPAVVKEAIPKWDLTNRTYSIVIDIGMYLSQIMIRSIPQLKWQLRLRTPVLTGLGWPKSDVFKPTDIMIMKAYSVVKGQSKDSGLRKTLEYWKKLAEETPERLDSGE